MTEDLLETSAAYKVLAVLLAYPAEDTIPVLRSTLGLDAGLDDLRRSYHAVFGGPLPGVLPPLETEYGQAHVFSKAQTLADLAGFYRAFGLEAVQGLHRVDHIATELEFLHALVAKERLAVSRGDREKADVCHDARRKMLADHLGSWGVPFLGLVAAQEGAGVYARVAGVAKEFLVEECRALGVEVAPREITPIREERPSGGETCAVPEARA